MSQIKALVDSINDRLKRMYPRADVGLVGHINFRVDRADGSVDQFDIKNLIMDAGEDEVAKLLCGEAADAFSYIAIGTDNTAAADSQTALVAEISSNGGERAQDASTGTAANVATIEVTFNFTGALAIVEVGLFNASSGGDMLARQVFSVINVDNGDSLTVTWNITVGTAR